MSDYAIVVATRNRLEALRASIPLFLGQSRPPARIVVVDKSDDHAAVAAFLGAQAAATSVPFEVIHSDRANLPYQRNLGLARVQEPITMMPDDDSLWFPETAAEIMKVYEADTGKRIGGVGGMISAVSPLSQGDAPENARRIAGRPGIESLRNRLEARFAPQPFNLYAQRRIAELGRPEGVLVVETVGGWRMSFRTEAVRSLEFDATLGSRVGYAQHEDKDVSLRLQKAGWLMAAAPGADVFHNVAPGKRAGGFAYGFCWIFNYAYICRKVFGDTAPGRGPVRRYLAYKTALYHLRPTSAHHRDIARGARAAMAAFDRLWSAPDDRLQEVFGEICDSALGNR